MYLDTIKSITDTEDAARQAKLEAQTSAKNKITEAEKAGRAAVAEAVSRAETENKIRMQTADQEAADNQAEIFADTVKHQADIRTQAGTKADMAANLIVERIVKS